MLDINRLSENKNHFGVSEGIHVLNKSIIIIIVIINNSYICRLTQNNYADEATSFLNLTNITFSFPNFTVTDFTVLFAPLILIHPL